MLWLQFLSLCASAALGLPTAQPPNPITAKLETLESVESVPDCLSASSPLAFTINNIAFQKYAPFPGTIDEGMDQMTLAFDVTNSGNGVNTACSFINGKYLGQWTDHGTKWYACGNRTIVDGTGATYVVRTNAQFHWSTWNLSVNQSWVCESGYEPQSVAANVSVLLAPNCSDTTTTGYDFKECSAPTSIGDTFPFPLNASSAVE